VNDNDFMSPKNVFLLHFAVLYEPWYNTDRSCYTCLTGFLPICLRFLPAYRNLNIFCGTLLLLIVTNTHTTFTDMFLYWYYLLWSLNLHINNNNKSYNSHTARSCS
jgi:hypothetical protein